MQPPVHDECHAITRHTLTRKVCGAVVVDVGVAAVVVDIAAAAAVVVDVAAVFVDVCIRSFFILCFFYTT